MHLTLASSLSLSLLFTSVKSATIVDTIKQRPELSQVAQLIPANPQWSTGTNKTIIAPTNDALAKAKTANTLPGNATGVFFLPSQGVDHRTRPNYKILKGVDTPILFDNFVPEGPPEIHLRTSMNNGLATGQVQCDDGWLYIANIAFEPPAKPSVAIPQGPPQSSAFVELFKQLNLLATLDSLKDVTILAPTNAALTAAQAELSKLAPNQLAYILSAHIVTGIKFTTEFGGAIQSINPQIPLNMTVGNEVVSVNGVRLGPVVDTPTSAGVVHNIGGIIMPNNVPAPGGPISLGSVQIVGNATATTSATPTSAATASATPTGTRGTANETGKSKPENSGANGLMAGSWVSAVVVGIVGLVGW